MKTTADVLKEFYTKAKKVEKELKTNGLLNRTSDLTQLHSIYSILFPSSCKNFYRWYCENKFERDILDEIYYDKEEIPVSGESYKKAVKLYDEHLKALKEYYIENYSDKAYSDNNSMQKDLNEICEESHVEGFPAWLKKWWLFLICSCSIVFVFLYFCIVPDARSCNDDKLKQHQNEIKHAFYNEVKDDKDFSKFDFKSSKPERRLQDPVEDEIKHIKVEDGKKHIKIVFRYF